MQKWASWYKGILVAWFALALPGMLIGLAWAGGEISTPRPNLVAWLLWLSVLAFFFSPILLWPWRSKNNN